MTALADDVFSAIQYTEANGEVCTGYVAEIRLKIKNLAGKRRVLIVKPTPEEETMWEFFLMVSPFSRHFRTASGYDSYETDVAFSVVVQAKSRSMAFLSSKRKRNSKSRHYGFYALDYTITA